VIEVTHYDLRRLVTHTGISADKLIKLFSPSDFKDDDDDWIRLSYGKRKIGLRKKPDETCIFLSENRHCTAYEARPMSCRVFPVDIVLDEGNKIIDFEMSDVVRDKFIRCKHYIGKSVPYTTFMRKAIQSQTETAAYWEKIKQWNDKPEKGGKNDFLNFLGIKTPKLSD
jgi:Fe-S-cluster containining protein